MRVAAHALLGTFILLSTTAGASEYLTADEQKGLIVGKTLDINNLETGRLVQGYFDPDGTFIVYVPWKDKESKRRWWFDGDKRCSSHPKRGDSCRSWKLAGEGVLHGFSESGEQVRELTNIRDGKQFNK